MHGNRPCFSINLKAYSLSGPSRAASRIDTMRGGSLCVIVFASTLWLLLLELCGLAFPISAVAFPDLLRIFAPPFSKVCPLCLFGLIT